MAVSRCASTNCIQGLGTASERDMPARFPDLVYGNIPNASNDSIAKLQSMYTYAAELPEKLAWDYTTDMVFGCSASNIALAYGDRARRFLFSVPPATHGLDISCMWLLPCQVHGLLIL
jgi:hypothetical protein